MSPQPVTKNEDTSGKSPNGKAYRSVVYKYAVGYKSDFDDLGMHQLRLRHELQNELVSIHKNHEHAVANLWNTRPEVAELTARIAELDQAAEDAAAAWNKSKVNTRDRKGDPELKAALAEIRQTLKETRPLRKAAKDAALDDLREGFAELTQQERAEVKATYAEWRERGLYWSTVNLVLNQDKRAEQAKNSGRKNGKYIERRYKRWIGEGQLSVQLQREANDPTRTPAALSDGESKWRNMAYISRQQDRKHRGLISIRVGTQDNRPIWLETDEVISHRPIPPDADVTDITISRRRLGSKHRLWAEISLRLPLENQTKKEGTTAFDLGWRMMSDGSIRVAVWRSTRGCPEIAQHLIDMGAVILDGEGGEVRIPVRLAERWKKSQDLRSIRDKEMEVMRQDLLTSWPDLDNLEQLDGITKANITQWRSPSRFVHLTNKLRGVDLPISRRMEEWRKQDKHLWNWQVNNMQTFIDTRKDVFVKVAHTICQVTGKIVLEPSFVAKVNQVPEESTHQGDHARKASVLAAPSSLALALKSAASKFGVEISKPDAAYSTLMHSACGYQNPPESALRSHLIKCAGCGETFDQDVSACWNLLKRDSTGPVPTPTPDSVR